jgi:Rieske Fe-S protein
LRLFSAACTHVGCVVRWNGFERCWDCPCHGSQFSVEGEPLQGPAHRPLEPFAPQASAQRRRA